MLADESREQSQDTQEIGQKKKKKKIKSVTKRIAW